MRQLSREERLRLLKFVCSFAWTDLKVTEEERMLIALMVDRHGFDETERQQIREWLEVPPRPEEVDPTEIPRAHREEFLAAARAVVAADGYIAQGERDSLEIFEELLNDPK